MILILVVFFCIFPFILDYFVSVRQGSFGGCGVSDRME